MERVEEATVQGDLPLPPTPDSAWLRVQVVAAQEDGPVEGQVVTVRDTNGLWPWPTVAEASVDEAGHAELEVPIGRSLQMHVQPGHTWQRSRLAITPLEAGEERALLLRLHPLRLLHALITVEDSAGLPVEGALISPLEEEGRFAPVTTDAVGHARLDGLRADWNTFFSVQASGFARGFGMVEEGEPPRTVTLREEARVAGRVTTASGSPAPGARMQVRADPQAHGVFTFDAVIEWNTVADPDGRFSFNGLPPGEGLLLSVKHHGQLSVERLEPLVPGDQQHDVQLSSGPTLLGKALDPKGQGVVGLGIELEPIHTLSGPSNRFGPLDHVDRRTVMTDSEGRFVFGPEENLHPGTWRLGTQGALDQRLRDSEDSGVGSRWLPVLREIELVPGEQTKEVLLTMETGQSISGFLLDPDEQPLRQGFVRAFQMDASGIPVRLQTSSIGEDGSFTLGPFPEGIFFVTGSNPARRLGTELKGIPSGTVGLRLVCTPWKGVIGRVVDQDGNPQQTRLWAFDRAEAGGSMWSLRVDGDGNFDLNFDSDVPYDFLAFSHRGVAGILSDVQLKAPSQEVLIVVEPAGEVSIDVGNIHNDTMHAVCIHRGKVVFRGDPWHLENWRWLPEGPIQLELWEGSRLLDQVAGTVLLGERLELSLRAPDDEPEEG